MPGVPTKPLIFISYSHKDRQWLEYVRSHLAPAAAHGVMTTWDDNQLQIGANWKGDISSALDACQVFILLVSRHSLVSKFILDHEVKRILDRRRNQAVPFCPIVVTPCYLDAVDWLTSLNYHPKDGKALSELSEAARDRVMEGIVREVAKIIEQIIVQKAVTTQDESQAPKNEPPKQDARSVTIPVPSVIDYGRLPDTPYRNLVGRDDELQTLDEAWAGKETNVLSIIAWGGAGKTALVNEWLKRSQADNYRGATAVLGWSFYSQGTKERATSAEQFVNWALGQLNVAAASTSATARGEALADAMAAARVLLVLDGVEPLQHGPGAQEGQLKDKGLRAFLRRFAAVPPASAHGILILTSRLEIHDIDRWKGSTDRPGAALTLDLDRLSSEAGVSLLRDNRVRGAERLLRAAVEEFEGHALALSLLAGLLVRRHQGDVQRRDRVGPLLQMTDARGHGHAQRVMQAYEKEWLKDEPVLWAIMRAVGLFDRPATVGCLDALRREPVIPGLTEPLMGLRSVVWDEAVFALREVRLLDPEDPRARGSLDAHPLVREWFGEQLRHTNQEAWRQAHGRLYEYLRDTAKEGDAPTLDDLAPLYQAIAHGCRAGRHQEALDDIFQDRISRGREAYATKHLGAAGSDLAAISWFFDRAYETPVASLTESAQTWVLSVAAFTLRSQGRLAEALPAMRLSLKGEERAENWRNAAITASNLSQADLIVGNIASAITFAATSTEYADREANVFLMVIARTTHGNALHAAGRLKEARCLFGDAERRLKIEQPELKFLLSLHGYQYCDFLIDQGRANKVQDRGEYMLSLESINTTLLDRALARLIIGRANLAIALAGARASDRRVNVLAAGRRLREALDLFVDADTAHHVPRALLALSTLQRSVGNWNEVLRHLDEIDEIAEPGPMQLYLADSALERARLTFARLEAYAPLHRLVGITAPKPLVPDAAELALLREDAAVNLTKARNLAADCGYHKRDVELSDLEAVLRGDRKFGDLAPRV